MMTNEEFKRIEEDSLYGYLSGFTDVCELIAEVRRLRAKIALTEPKYRLEPLAEKLPERFR